MNFPQLCNIWTWLKTPLSQKKDSQSDRLWMSSDLHCQKLPGRRNVDNCGTYRQCEVEKFTCCSRPDPLWLGALLILLQIKTWARTSSCLKSPNLKLLKPSLAEAQKAFIICYTAQRWLAHFLNHCGWTIERWRPAMSMFSCTILTLDGRRCAECCWITTKIYEI